jgi:hypothetical protein
MPMKEDLKTTVDEAYDDGKHADGEEADENFIIIKTDKEVDRCCFPFLYLLRVTFFLRYGLGVLVVYGYVSSDQGINIDRGTM